MKILPDNSHLLPITCKAYRDQKHRIGSMADVTTSSMQGLKRECQGRRRGTGRYPNTLRREERAVGDIRWPGVYPMQRPTN